MPIKIVVGLGNPGKKYERTRHNIGARVVKFFEGPGPVIRLPQEVKLVIPPDGVFMNNCGPWIAWYAHVYHHVAEEMLIVCDDFMLTYPQLRIRTKGSSGGHNGLQSILDAFKTLSVPRLRIGVGLVPPDKDPAEYVLENFEQSVNRIQTDLIIRAADAVRICVTSGLEAAMNKYNPKVETA